MNNDALIMLDRSQLKRWLDLTGYMYYQCETCQALHLPHMQTAEGVSDAKVDIINNVLVLSVMAELRLTSLLPASYELSQVNASSLLVKTFIDIQDEGYPRLIMSHSFNLSAGIALRQFKHFITVGEEQISTIMGEFYASGMLLSEEESAEQEEILDSPLLH